ncbi:MAG: hypothetical protein IPM85_16670 [Chitinophagaceae bacterium]|nr:hypothetical protein [Chitinophagaceae bacterium]
MKQLITLLLILAVTAVAAQETKTKGSFLGSIESNSQVYLKDSKRNIEVPDDPFRSNTYLQLQYNYKKWTVGVQGEAYLPKALLNLNPKHKGVGVGTAFVNYKSTKLDITAGHFYEQFGSGLLLRSWEDRFLGINNAILGGRIKYSPVSHVRFIAVAGKQRSGFDISNGIVFGMDAEIDILSVSEKQQSDLSLGISYVGRNEDFKTPLTNPTFKETTNGLSGRLNYSKKGFTASAEYVHKSKDGILYDKAHVDTTFVKPGSALLLNMGYAKKGTGFNITLRRIENMSFYSEREPEILEGNESSIYFNDKMINYIPSLTKQHHFNLANIYVYQAQQLVSLDPSTNIGKAGDVGGMIDFFSQF